MAYRCITHKCDHKRASPSARSSGGGGYEGPDLISALPNELLHHVLSFVTTPEAIRTSALSRRWVDVWTGVPRLRLLEEEARNVEHIPDHFDSILHRYADNMDITDLAISYHWDWPEVDERLASSWAGFAARRVTGRFDLSVTTQIGSDDSFLKLPCFERATEISLYASGMAVRLPPALDAGAGDFARLTKLRMSELRFSDAGEGISDVVSRRCPRLETLELELIDGVEALSLCSESLLSLRLVSVSRLRLLEVEAGNLRKMQVEYCLAERSWWSGGAAGAVMRLSTPALEELGWEDIYPHKVELVRLPTCLKELVVSELPSHIIERISQSDFTKILELFSRADVLRLTSPMPAALDSEEQESLIHSVQLPYYSELDLGVITNGHKSYGSAIVHFLRRNSSIRNLTLTLYPYHHEEKSSAPLCMPNCICREQLNWWDQEISLNSLEQLAIKEISGNCEEKRLIYFIIRNSKVLKKITVVFRRGLCSHRWFLRNLRKLSTSRCTIELDIPCTTRFCYSGMKKIIVTKV